MFVVLSCEEIFCPGWRIFCCRTDLQGIVLQVGGQLCPVHTETDKLPQLGQRHSPQAGDVIMREVQLDDLGMFSSSTKHSILIRWHGQEYYLENC